MPFRWIRKNDVESAFVGGVRSAVRRTAGAGAAVHVIRGASDADHLNVAVVLLPGASADEVRARLEREARGLWAAHGRDVSFMVLVRGTTTGQDAMIAASERLAATRR